MKNKGKFDIIEGPTIAHVIKMANSYGITKDEFVDIVFNDNVVILIYYA